MIVLDSSGLLCLLDRGERDHARVKEAAEREPGPYVTTDFVLAEVDYLVLKRLGLPGERAFLRQVRDGALYREPVSNDDIERASAVIERFGDQEVGLTDATLMVVAERLGVLKVLTLDHRRFAGFRDRRGRPLELIP